MDSDSEGEDAANWVAKNRRLEEERKRAEERVCFLIVGCQVCLSMTGNCIFIIGKPKLIIYFGAHISLEIFLTGENTGRNGCRFWCECIVE